MEGIKEIKTKEDFKWLEEKIEPTSHTLNWISHKFKVGEEEIGLLWNFSAKTYRVEAMLFEYVGDTKYKLIYDKEKFKFSDKIIRKKQFTFKVPNYAGKNAKEVINVLKRQKQPIYYLGERTSL